MTKGGYQILDLKNFVFKSVGGGEYNSINIPGIYEKIKGTNKSVLVSGFALGDQEGINSVVYRDFFTTPIPVNDFTEDGYGTIAETYPNSYVIKLPYKVNSAYGISVFVVQTDDTVTVPRSM